MTLWIFIGISVYHVLFITWFRHELINAPTDKELWGKKWIDTQCVCYENLPAENIGGCFFIREHGRVSLATLFSGTHERK